MAIEIKNARDLFAPWTNWFLMGDTGSGKTTIAASFPFPLFIVPKNEASIMTLRGLDIPYIEIETPDDMQQTLAMLEQRSMQSQRLLQQGKNDEAWEAFPWQTVVVESLSHYTDLVIEALTGTKDGWQSGKMDQQKWGHLSSHLRSLHTRIRSLPVHAVYTALAQMKEGDNGIVSGGPLMSGAMAYKLPSACDAIVYCEAMSNGTRRAHFQRYKTYPARVRMPAGTQFPAHVDGFTWAHAAPYFGHEG